MAFAKCCISFCVLTALTTSEAHTIRRDVRANIVKEAVAKQAIRMREVVESSNSSCSSFIISKEKVAKSAAMKSELSLDTLEGFAAPVHPSE